MNDDPSRLPAHLVAWQDQQEAKLTPGQRSEIDRLVMEAMPDSWESGDLRWAEHVALRLSEIMEWAGGTHCPMPEP